MLDLNKCYNDDCLDGLKKLEDNSVDLITTDPPYFLINDSGSGFMGKDWDSINIDKGSEILLKSKGFVNFVERFFLSMKVELNMEEVDIVQESVSISTEKNRKVKKSRSNANIVEKNMKESRHKLKESINSARTIVITKDVLLEFLKESLQNHTSELQNHMYLLKDLSENALFAIPISCIVENLANIVQESALKFPTENVCSERRIHLTLMDEVRIKGVIEGMIGSELECPFTYETNSHVNTVGNIVKEEKYNAIILKHTESHKTMKWIIWLLFVIYVIQKSSGDKKFYTKKDLGYALISLFNESWLKECLRVLKPGAFAFIMSAPRQDVLSRMIVNIEDAGFKTDFTSIYWTYFCVSEDTEILTKEGFKDIHTFSESDKVFSLDIENDVLKLTNVEGKFVYDFYGDMINIKTLNTDQLITPNHEVLLKSKTHSRYNYGNYEYKKASDLLNGRKYPYYKLPMARKFQGNLSIGEDFAELLGWIIAEGEFHREKNKPNTWDIRISQSSVNKEHVDRIRELLNNLKIKHSEYKYKRDYNYVNKYKKKEYILHTFYINGEWKHKIAQWIPNKKPRMELFLLKENELQKLFTALINGDGSRRNDIQKAVTFYQKDKSILDFVQIIGTLLGRKTSRNEKKSALNIAGGNDTEIQNINKINEVFYKGKVWCIKTKYGNFVARRNGKVFITGNSGFPKSMDIEKAVEKKLGEDSVEAKALDGAYGGFQPKPAVEIVIVAMKPLAEKSYTEQALANGHGLTWLNDARIPYKSDNDIEDSKGNFKPLSNYNGMNTNYELGIKKIDTHQNPQGRFPANLLCMDDVLNDGLMRKGGGAVVSPPSGRFSGLTYNGGVATEGDERPFDGYDDEGSASRYFDLDAWWDERIKSMDPAVLETFPFLLVPKASQGEKNAGLDDVEAQYMDGSRKVGSPGGTNPRNRGAQTPRKNPHPTIKPVKLFTYLITLGSRPGDIVLDPFGGSGTTGVAAEISERKYLLFEMEQDYHELACKRIEYQQKVTKRENPNMLSKIFKMKC